MLTPHKKWTEQEKKWLEARSKPEYPAACVRIHKKDKWDLDQEDCRDCLHNESRAYFCPLAPDYIDAALFEAHVGKKLAQKIPLAMHIAQVKDNNYVMDAETALMLARLDVEEKMTELILSV